MDTFNLQGWLHALVVLGGVALTGIMPIVVMYWIISLVA